MKKNKQCPKCGSLRVGHLERLPGRGGESQGIGHTAGNPASTWLAHFVSHEFEAYVCTECGYLETHVKVPTQVPYEEIEGFRWVNPETPEEGPCR